MAINFPNTPVNGSTYDFNGVRYTFTQPNVAFEGYWRVTTPGSVGIATSNEISAGVDGAKYVTPLGLVGTVEWDLLVDAVATATADTLALRNGAGQISVGDATLDEHAVNFGQIVLTDDYDSGPQTITGGGLLTLDHGLGVEPRAFDFYLVCLVAEDGYSIGDRIDAKLNSSTPSTSVFNSYSFTDSQILFRFSNASSSFVTGNKSSGAQTGLTNSRWNLVVRAYA
jgi:hypothetical protein